MDDRGRDQFVIRFGSDTEVYWNDARIGKPDPVYQRGVRGIMNQESVHCSLGRGQESTLRIPMMPHAVVVHSESHVVITIPLLEATKGGNKCLKHATPAAEWPLPLTCVWGKQDWTESFVQWSPSGNLLATIHRQGAAIWGNPNWQRLTRYPHPQV